MSCGYIYSFKWDIWPAGGDIWCFRSPADSLQKLLERRPCKVFYCPDMYFLLALYLLRGGLARFIGNCPDILYFLSALYLLMRYYRSGNFLSFHSAQCHSVAKVAFKRHVIINTTQLLSMCNNVQRLPSCIVILSIWSPLKWFRLAKRKHKEDPTAASAFVEETIGRVRWPKLSQILNFWKIVMWLWLWAG